METEPIAPVVTDPNARTWGMLAHALTLLGYIAGIAHVIPALIVYLAKKDEHEFIAEQARESLNFQLTILPLLVFGWVSWFFCLGWLILPVVYLFQLVMVIVASIQANDGKHYRYPLTIRFVK